VTTVGASASFSEKLDIQVSSTAWEGHPIETIAPSLDTLEDIEDIRTATEAQILYEQQGQNAFVSLDDLKADRD
jgi:hypothetical protein